MGGREGGGERKSDRELGRVKGGGEKEREREAGPDVGSRQ